MKLGLYGGSFDPVHFGHLLLAEICRESLQLDEVWFVPAHRPPHKPGRALTDGLHRLQMLTLATGGHAVFRVSTLELDRKGTSFTVDTLEQIQSLHPHTQLYLLMGADTLRDLPTWRSPQRICELAIPAVVHRGGMPPPDLAALPAAWTKLNQVHAPVIVDMPLFELSSRSLRQRVASGQSIRYRTPAAVEQYIHQHALYVEQDQSSRESEVPSHD